MDVFVLMHNSVWLRHSYMNWFGFPLDVFLKVCLTFVSKKKL